MTDIFAQQNAQARKGPDLDLVAPPELFGAETNSSVGSPVGPVTPTDGGSHAMERDDMIFAGLFDGHGGDECARFLQQRFYRNLSREISYRCTQNLHGDAGSADAATTPAAHLAVTPELMHDAFTSAYLMSNLQLRFSDNIAALTSGATAVTAVVAKNSSGSRWLHLANVGDSAAILCTARPDNNMLWECQRLHQTHRTSTPSERSRVVSSGGFVLRGRLNGSLAVTRAFGNHSYFSAAPCQPEPETSPLATPAARSEAGRGRGRASSMEGLSVLPATRSVELDSDGSSTLFLVLCCDGVTDVMSDEQIVAVVHEGYTKLLRRAQKEQQQQQQQQQQQKRDLQGPAAAQDETATECESAPAVRGVAGKLARWLVHTALKRGSRDNCSAIVLLF